MIKGDATGWLHRPFSMCSVLAARLRQVVLDEASITLKRERFCARITV
jgi:hypothetical protein